MSASRGDFYPRSPYGERPVDSSSICSSKIISIHALLTESDVRQAKTRHRFTISIHALLTESDGHQSSGNSIDTYFYPRSPYGERRKARPKLPKLIGISIHALLTESDCFIIVDVKKRGNFYPRSPYGERQFGKLKPDIGSLFLSTLSLRRATAKIHTCGGNAIFLSTLSLRRATAKVHKTVEHFCAYETNFMEIASSC